MEQNDKMPGDRAGERKPRPQNPPVHGAPADHAENDAEGGQNRRRRNRHRHRGHGHRETPAGGIPVEGSVDAAAADKVQQESHPADDEAGESKKRRRNRNRRRGRRDNADHPDLTDSGQEVTMKEEGEEVADEDSDEVISAEADLTPDEPSAEPDEEEADETVSESPAQKSSKLPQYTVAGIRFRPGGKIYYFDPGDMACSENAHVIVETARGLEFGIVALGNRQVSGRDVVLPLRRVVRFATEEDERRHESNLEKETEAYNLCLSRIEAHRLDMKLVDVEYAFDNSKLLFYFTSEERVDFRELVKDLASIFRTRIELRQIGIRDEAKLMGGLGVCGRPFCCKSFLPDFVQVSIKMAKEQNLSLNSAKISGACGRLMCCLRYEYDTYVEEAAITPKVDAIVDTPDGEGVVTESMPLKGIVKVVLDKEPNAYHLYRREDVTVKGHAKKRKTNERDGKKTEEKK